MCVVSNGLLHVFVQLSKLTFYQLGAYDQSVLYTNAQLTEGRSARDQPKQPPAKKKAPFLSCALLCSPFLSCALLCSFPFLSCSSSFFPFCFLVVPLLFSCCSFVVLLLFSCCPFGVFFFSLVLVVLWLSFFSLVLLLLSSCCSCCPLVLSCCPFLVFLLVFSCASCSALIVLLLSSWFSCCPLLVLLLFSCPLFFFNCPLVVLFLSSSGSPLVLLLFSCPLSCPLSLFSWAEGQENNKRGSRRCPHCRR